MPSFSSSNPRPTLFPAPTAREWELTLDLARARARRAQRDLSQEFWLDLRSRLGLGRRSQDRLRQALARHRAPSAAARSGCG